MILKTGNIIELRYCNHCKKTDVPLMKVNKNHGKQYFMCRECNTERMRRYMKTSKGRAHVRQAVYASIKRHQYKQDARLMLRDEIHRGNVQRPEKCSKCKNKGMVHGHHGDYSKPLEVTWLCRVCHVDLHKKEKSKIMN